MLATRAGLEDFFLMTEIPERADVRDDKRKAELIFRAHRRRAVRRAGRPHEARRRHGYLLRLSAKARGRDPPADEPYHGGGEATLGILSQLGLNCRFGKLSSGYLRI